MISVITGPKLSWSHSSWLTWGLQLEVTVPEEGRVSVELPPEKGKLFIMRAALVRTFLRKSEKSNHLNSSIQRTPGYTVFQESTKNEVSVQWVGEWMSFNNARTWGVSDWIWILVGIFVRMCLHKIPSLTDCALKIVIYVNSGLMPPVGEGRETNERVIFASE